MSLPRPSPVVWAALVAALAGCSTSGSLDREPAVNSRNDLQRLQSQIYEAATGPNHLGSVYNKPK